MKKLKTLFAALALTLIAAVGLQPTQAEAFVNNGAAHRNKNLIIVDLIHLGLTKPQVGQVTSDMQCATLQPPARHYISEMSSQFESDNYIEPSEKVTIHNCLIALKTAKNFEGNLDITFTIPLYLPFILAFTMKSKRKSKVKLRLKTSS